MLNRFNSSPNQALPHRGRPLWSARGPGVLNRQGDRAARWPPPKARSTPYRCTHGSWTDGPVNPEIDRARSTWASLSRDELTFHGEGEKHPIECLSASHRGRRGSGNRGRSDAAAITPGRPATWSNDRKPRLEWSDHINRTAAHPANRPGLVTRTLARTECYTPDIPTNPWQPHCDAEESV